MRLPDSSHDLRFDEEIKRWDEAVPLGNGLLGCLIWGSGSPLRFSLDRGDLWDTRLAPQAMRPDFNYKTLIGMVNAGDQSDILGLFDSAYRHPTPTKIPAGRIELYYGTPSSGFKAVLKIRDAEAVIRMDFGSESYSVINTYLHAEDSIGIINVSGTAVLPELRIGAHAFNGLPSDAPGLKESVSYADARQLGYPDPISGTDEDGSVSWFRQDTAADGWFGIMTARHVISDYACTIAYTVFSDRDGDEGFENAKINLIRASRSAYDVFKEPHDLWWRRFWEKSSITLPDKKIERMWYRTNYLFGSCSRKGRPPMPLQGVWTADENGLPPWKGDYHSDLNTQMSYWHYLKANHIEEGESFTDFLWELVPRARDFAREFFDAPGICLPSVMGINGEALSGWSQYSINLINQAWLCATFGDHWRCTGDDAFLRDKAYPYFKMTAECILRWLKPAVDGKLKLPLSSSPEIHDNSIEAWMKPNTNNDIALLKYLFKTLSEMASELKTGEQADWLAIYDRIEDYHIADNKALKVSADENLEESHRHFGHAMCVYPLKLMDYDEDEGAKRVIDSTVSRLEKLGTGLWVGFSFTWMAEFYAIQGNGEGAARKLKVFDECFCSPNGFNLNGDYRKRGESHFHYRPFTLEANMSAADAVQEMLMKSSRGKIRVFRAVPEDWKKGKTAFSGLRAESGFTVSSELTKGRISYILLKADKAGSILIENGFNADRLKTEIDGIVDHIDCKQGGYFKVTMKRGQKCRITGD